MHRRTNSVGSDTWLAALTWVSRIPMFLGRNSSQGFAARKELNDTIIVGSLYSHALAPISFGTMMICGSLRLEAREPYHLTPLLGFVRDELAEIDGRERKRRDAQKGKLRPELGIG